MPREYDGAGLDYLTYGLIVEEVGRGCSAMRTVISVQTSLVCSAILRWGTEEQKRHYLPKLCSGEWLGCFGLTEPDTGSDAADQKTRARRSNGSWVINGSKMFISLGDHAKVALIFAQTDPEKGHRGVACFLVDTDQPGFQPQPIHHKMGLRGSDTAALGTLSHIDRILERKAVGRARAVRGAIAVAREHAAEIRREPGQAARAHVIEAPAQLLERRRRLLERGKAVQHVVGVDLVDRRQVFGSRRPQLHPLTENKRAPRDRECA